MNTSRTFFYIILAVVFSFTLYFYREYISTLFLAVIIAYMLQPIYRYFRNKREAGVHLSTVLTFATFALFIIIPLLIVANITIAQIVQFYSDLSSLDVPEDFSLNIVLSQANDVLARLPFITYQLTEEAILNAAESVINVLVTVLRGQVVAISNASIRIVVDIVLFIVFVITFIPNVNKVTAFITRVSPLSDDVNNLYMRRITVMSVAMLKGSIVIAFCQAVATGFLLWLTGVPYVFFFGMVTFFLCLVPLGSGVILIPAGVVFLLLGSITKGILLIAAYFLFIGNIDNVVRPMLVAKEAMVHPVMMLVSIFAGLATFGFWGFVYGPLVAILFITTLEVYEKEFA